MAYWCHWLSTDRIIPRSVLVLSLVWFELTVLPLHYDASSVVHIVLGWQLCCIHCTYDDSFVRVGVAVWIWKSSSEFDKNFPRWVSAVGWRTILIYPSWYIKGYQQQMIGEGNDIFLPVKCKRYSVRLFYIFGWKCWLNRIHLRW